MRDDDIRWQTFTSIKVTVRILRSQRLRDINISNVSP